MSTTCFGRSTGIFHIGPGGGFFASGGLCMNTPIDASSYPSEDRLYVYANISGYSSANIRTIFPDGTDDVHYENGDYMWIYWDWNGWEGDVIFELRSGTSVKATISTYIGSPPNIAITDFVPTSYTSKHGESVDVSFVVRNYGGITVCFRYVVKVNGVKISSYPAWSDNACADIQHDKGSAFYEQYYSYAHSILNKYETDFDVTVELIYVPLGKAGIVIDSKTITIKSEYDPCEGIVCDDICEGLTLWEQECYGGVCDVKAIKETNSPTCGYVQPDDESHDEPDDESHDEPDDESHDEPDDDVDYDYPDEGTDIDQLLDEAGISRDQATTAIIVMAAILLLRRIL